MGNQLTKKKPTHLKTRSPVLLELLLMIPQKLLLLSHPLLQGACKQAFELHEMLGLLWKNLRQKCEVSTINLHVRRQMLLEDLRVLFNLIDAIYSFTQLMASSQCKGQLEHVGWSSPGQVKAGTDVIQCTFHVRVTKLQEGLLGIVCELNL